MRTNTEKYEFSHGSKPKGRGCWILELTGTDGNGSYTTQEYTERGTLSEARKNAVRRFKSEVGGVKEVTEVEVLP